MCSSSSRTRAVASGSPAARGMDWLLILNRCHLEHVLRTYVEHYNRERPHRALNLRPPQPRSGSEPTPSCPIQRRDRLGGLVHEYYQAAA